MFIIAGSNHLGNNFEDNFNKSSLQENNISSLEDDCSGSMEDDCDQSLNGDDVKSVVEETEYTTDMLPAAFCEATVSRGKEFLIIQYITFYEVCY